MLLPRNDYRASAGAECIRKKNWTDRVSRITEDTLVIATAGVAFMETGKDAFEVLYRAGKSVGRNRVVFGSRHETVKR